jgi:hypothetical protein
MCQKRGNLADSKRAQVTIFIIVAIVLVLGIVLFFAIRNRIEISAVPKNLEPAYLSFLECIEVNTMSGIDILGTQGGYIELPEFEPGSEYAPLSSQLDFYGNPVPYWWYLSGNGIEREQVPALDEMENDLGEFVSNKIEDCNLDIFYDQGLEINLDNEDISADVNIEDNFVRVKLNAPLSLSDGESSAIVSSHDIEVNSQIGEFYNIAREIYNKEQQDLFLENYAIDALRLYAPVDGVEVSCAPEIWIAQDVVDEILGGVEANTLSLKSEGSYYDLSSKENEYFVVKGLDSGNARVQFLTSPLWPYKVEVWPSNDGIMIAEPVGNQQGLGILGFCYVPYHFVYDLHYPILVQLYNDDEIFQFPISVVIKGNKPRISEAGASAIDYGLPELCQYKTKEIEVSTFDTGLRPVNAEISFECFGTECSIGETLNGQMQETFPACVNGFVRARADGYRDARQQLSTNEDEFVDLIMDREYTLGLQIYKDGRVTNDRTIVSFQSEFDSQTVVYPEQREVKLSEGQYNISLLSYASGDLTLAGENVRQCVEVPSAGIGSVFGATREECFDVVIPAQMISEVLIGGGNQQYFMVESELAGSKTIQVGYDSFTQPNTIEDLQNNYIQAETEGLDILFI